MYISGKSMARGAGGLMLALGLAMPLLAQAPAPGNGNAADENQIFRILPGKGIQGVLQTKIGGPPQSSVLNFNPFQVSNLSPTQFPTGGGGGAYGASFYRNPWWGGYGASVYGEGGDAGSYLSGAANVINAQGNFLIRNQQARLIDQQVLAAKMETRQRIFNEWLYERALTPTLEDERERVQQLELRRQLNDPPVTEIYSGQSLNVLLNNIQKLNSQGVKGPPIYLDPQVLKYINVTVPSVSGGSVGNFGLLKSADNLQWPTALRLLPPVDQTTELRNQLGILFQEAINQARAGRQVDANILQGLRDGLTQLQGLVKQYAIEMTFTQYSEAKRYLSDLESGLKALESQQANKFVSGQYTAKGNTVQEMVENMTREGLTFAPAVPGEEAAYRALQRAMASYDMGARTLAGLPPPGQ
ncbi:MAG: hypothetical protein ACK4RK_07430 [Gemmataceae bacterium]